MEVAVVGKYVELPDAYLSVKESLIHAAVEHNAAVNIHWVHSEDVDSGVVEGLLSEMDGVVVPGGFGERGIEGKLQAARYARAEQRPLPRPLPRPAGDDCRVRRATTSRPTTSTPPSSTRRPRIP